MRRVAGRCRRSRWSWTPGVEPLAADDAQARAVGLAEWRDRLGERDRLAEQGPQVQLVVVGQAQPPRARRRSQSERRSAGRWLGRTSSRIVMVEGHRRPAEGSGRTPRRARSGAPRRRGPRGWCGQPDAALDRRCQDEVRPSGRCRPVDARTRRVGAGRALESRPASGRERRTRSPVVGALVVLVRLPIAVHRLVVQASSSAGGPGASRRSSVASLVEDRDALLDALRAPCPPRASRVRAGANAYSSAPRPSVVGVVLRRLDDLRPLGLGQPA